MPSGGQPGDEDLTWFVELVDAELRDLAAVLRRLDDANE
jgi:hypothetical protein